MSNMYYNRSYDTLDTLGYKSNYTGKYKFKTLDNKKYIRNYIYIQRR